MVESFNPTILKEKAVGKEIASTGVEKKIFQFKPEAKTVITEELKLKIHTLTGKSMQDYKDEGRKFNSTWHRDYPEFELRKSITSEAAIPEGIILPGSTNKNFDGQRDMVIVYDQKIREKVKGVKAIWSNTPDNVNLFNNILDDSEKNKDILRQVSARSADYSPIPSIFGKYYVVINPDPETGILLNGYNKGAASKDVGVIAMVVPEEVPALVVPEKKVKEKESAK